jgi:Pretoxin HINT domain
MSNLAAWSFPYYPTRKISDLKADSCPEIESGPGRVVTGVFRHWRGEVYELRVESEPAAIVVTREHPFWSVDRNDWTQACALRVGERLQAQDGRTPRVLSFEPRDGVEPVYNIEVEGDHCYRVGEQGLLVHNQSAPGTGAQQTDQGKQDCPPGCHKQPDLFPGIYSPPNPNLSQAGALRRTAVAIHSMVTGIARNESTVALAEVVCPDGTREISAAGSGGSLTPSQRTALRALGVRVIERREGTGHAEQNIMNNLRDGTQILRWGISSASLQSPEPCVRICAPLVQAFPPGNPTIER